MSTFCVSVFIEPPVDGFPRSHRQPLANPFDRHRRFPPQTPRQADLHRVALAPQRQIGWLPPRLFQSQRHQPRRLVLRAFSAFLSIAMNLPIGLGAGLAQGGDKQLPVGVLQEHRFPAVAAAHQMIDGPRILQAKFSRHVGSMPHPARPVNQECINARN